MSNIEIEYKYRITDHKSILEKLESLGAVFKSENHAIDTYFLVPKNDGRQYLRIREKDGKGELDYHFVESDSLTKEWETEVKDAKMTGEILENLGFRIDVVIDKKRKDFDYKNSEIVLDTVRDLGEFIEIESPNMEELLGIAAELGLGESDRVKGAGYPDLLREKLVKNSQGID